MKISSPSWLQSKGNSPRPISLIHSINIKNAYKALCQVLGMWSQIRCSLCPKELRVWWRKLMLAEECCFLEYSQGILKSQERGAFKSVWRGRAAAHCPVRGRVWAESEGWEGISCTRKGTAREDTKHTWMMADGCFEILQAKPSITGLLNFHVSQNHMLLISVLRIWTHSGHERWAS